MIIQHMFNDFPQLSPNPTWNSWNITGRNMCLFDFYTSIGYDRCILRFYTCSCISSAFWQTLNRLQLERFTVIVYLMEKSNLWVRKTRKLLFKLFWRFKRSYHSLFMQMFNKILKTEHIRLYSMKGLRFFYYKSIFFNARDMCIHLPFFAKDLICFQVGQILPYKSADVVDVWLRT